MFLINTAEDQYLGLCLETKRAPQYKSYLLLPEDLYSSIETFKSPLRESLLHYKQNDLDALLRDFAHLYTGDLVEPFFINIYIFSESSISFNGKGTYYVKVEDLSLFKRFNTLAETLEAIQCS